MKRLSLALSVIILASILVGCEPADSPEKAAREWLDALLNLDGNTLSKRTCDAQQEEIQSGAIWLSAIAAFGEMLTGQREQADISDLQFVTISKSGDTAQVRVTGEIRTAVLAIAQTQEVDETWQMVRENGKWKWCGYAEKPKTVLPLPKATPTVTPIQAKATQQPPPPTETPLVPTPVPGVAPVGNWKVMVHSAEEVEEYEGRKPAEGHKFYQVFFTIENVSPNLLYLSSALWRAEAAWQEYTYEGTIDIQEGYLPPEFRAFGQAVFDVPVIAKEPTFAITPYEGEPIEFVFAPGYPPLPTSRTDLIRKMGEPFVVDKYWEITPVSSTFVLIKKWDFKGNYALLLKAKVKNLYGYDQDLNNNPTLQFQVFADWYIRVVTTSYNVWYLGAKPTRGYSSYSWLEEAEAIETVERGNGLGGSVLGSSPLAPGLEKIGYFWLNLWGRTVDRPIALIIVMSRKEGEPIAWAAYELAPSVQEAPTPTPTATPTPTVTPIPTPTPTVTPTPTSTPTPVPPSVVESTPVVLPVETAWAQFQATVTADAERFRGKPSAASTATVEAVKASQFIEVNILALKLELEGVRVDYVASNKDNKSHTLFPQYPITVVYDCEYAHIGWPTFTFIGSSIALEAGEEEQGSFFIPEYWLHTEDYPQDCTILAVESHFEPTLSLIH